MQNDYFIVFPLVKVQINFNLSPAPPLVYVWICVSIEPCERLNVRGGGGVVCVQFYTSVFSYVLVHA